MDASSPGHQHFVLEHISGAECERMGSGRGRILSAERLFFSESLAVGLIRPSSLAGAGFFVVGK